MPLRSIAQYMQLRPRPPMDSAKPSGHGVPGDVAAAAVNACLVAAAAAGVALLAWWSLAFHRDNRRLWMVPLGLVLACTPAVVCFAVSTSESARERGGEGADEAGAAPLSAVVVVDIK